jgi:hypothetical protein
MQPKRTCKKFVVQILGVRIKCHITIFIYHMSFIVELVK